MTTSSGKPPFDEQGLDSRWDAGTDAQAGAPDSSSGEPLTPRQAPAVPRAGADATDSAAEKADETPAASPLYGTVVPYGGDEHTEEIDPVVLDAPLAPPPGKTPSAPSAALKAAAAEPARNFEMKAPGAQVLLSDLFDSVPSSGALAPPDPAAFTSSRPPPERPPSEAPPAGRDAIVGLPSINVGNDGARSEPELAQRNSPRAEAEPPQRSAPRAPTPPTPAARSEAAEPKGQRSFAEFETVRPQAEALDVEMSTATVRLPAQPRATDADLSTASRRSPPEASPLDPEMTTATVRLPPDWRTADPEMSTATIKLSREAVAAGLGSNPSHSRPSNSRPSNSRPSNPPPRPPQPSSPALNEPGVAGLATGEAAAPADPSASTPSPPGVSPNAAPAADVARFPSEVPTSRPPDVMLGAMPGAASRAAANGVREPKAPPQATVAAPASTPFKVREASQLPSIMLAADVEAEPDSAARRAMRAARATVRLELPPGFGRPGSPIAGGAAGSGGPVTGSPVAASHPLSGAPLGTFMPSSPTAGAAPWLANPRTKRLLGAALAGLLLFVTLMFALSPRTGSLVVTALAPGSRAVDDVTIFIDGRPLCDVSPCRIKGLAPGVHTLRASAPNLASQAEETVEITAGDEATYNIDLLAVAPEVRSGGMRVPAAETPLTLYVDGKRVGKLPQEVSGLAAGKHWIKLDPEDGSAAIEKSVNVIAGDIVEVEPKAAKRDKALVTIRLGRGSEGAQVTLDDAFLLDFPAELELEPNTVHTLVATKPGYEDLSLDVEVAEGETEKLIEVSLTPLESGRKSRPAKAARKAPAKPAPTTASTALADSTQGLLNISSVPPSQIILNGRPLGTTPKTGILVPGDSLQTIVFVHPKMGRRRAQKFVPAGKERTVSIRF